MKNRRPNRRSSSAIKVVARFRPPNALELAQGSEVVVNLGSEDTLTIDMKSSGDNAGKHTFTFDRCFDMTSKQHEIFEYSIKSTVDDVLNGYNGTVFAYGQTGSGKTFTMMGADIDDEDLKGVIPRIVEQVFASILESPSNMEYTVRVSYMEIYMERIRDLLNPHNDNLPIHEDKTRGVYVKDLLEVYVSSIPEVYEVMRRGGQARVVASTNMNAESSRSHSIFVLTVSQKNIETGSTRTGQLFLVDLAGSEKVGKTGAKGQTLEEAKKINKSLSALGNVINALTEHAPKAAGTRHIPYRDSKLTRILQESLGGNSRTTLIINCSPASFNDAETLSTLRFGTRAKTIKNKARMNVELSPAELKQLLKESKAKILSFQEYTSELENEVLLWRGGEIVPREKWVVQRQLVPDEPTTAPTKRGSIVFGTPSRDGRSTPTMPMSPGLASVALQREISTRSQPESGRTTPTPSGPILLDRDEREEFLKRENELQDSIAEKESALADQEKLLISLKEELAFVKSHEHETGKTLEKLTSDLNEAKMLLEKTQFENKEQGISLDGLKEANAELQGELDDLKKEIFELRLQRRETGGMLAEDASTRGRRKEEMMKEMLASFPDLELQDGSRVNSVLSKMDSSPQVSLTREEAEILRAALTESQALSRQTEKLLKVRGDDADTLAVVNEMLETRLVQLEDSYAELIVKKVSDSGGDAVALRREMDELMRGVKRRGEEGEASLRNLLEERERENEKLRAVVEEYKTNSSNLRTRGDHVAQQLVEFEAIKKSLMRDLQNRCERVVELEISLDEIREQYDNVIKANNNRSQQKKMAFLERNLEQLTNVQRGLVEQNSTLKKEVAIAERKLAARNERIESLEQLLHEAQESLASQNHKFEQQLALVRERLETARIQRASSAGGAVGIKGVGGFFQGRIAKPLRGGGGGGVETLNSNIGKG